MKEDFKFDYIRTFQREEDFSLMFGNSGKTGITNCIHLLGSGYISNYLFYYKNPF
jgi:hypothetical protein